MAGMFAYSTFNQNPCEWNSVFPYELFANHNGTGIFYGSNCIFQDNPQELERGPFCSSSCDYLTSTSRSRTFDVSVEPLSVEPLSVEPLSVEPLSVEPSLSPSQASCIDPNIQRIDLRIDKPKNPIFAIEGNSMVVLHTAKTQAN
jgi:hypothetical protein